jgi:hypothetical protein
MLSFVAECRAKTYIQSAYFQLSVWYEFAKIQALIVFWHFLFPHETHKSPFGTWRDVGQLAGMYPECKHIVRLGILMLNKQLADDWASYKKCGINGGGQAIFSPAALAAFRLRNKPISAQRWFRIAADAYGRRCLSEDIQKYWTEDDLFAHYDNIIELLVQSSKHCDHIPAPTVRGESLNEYRAIFEAGFDFVDEIPYEEENEN